MKEYPYWWDTVPAIPGASHQTSVEGRAFDVAVVGAGYTGLAAACHMAKAGAAVVVIDRDGIGSGASSRNGGQVLTGLRVNPATLVARYGEHRARELFDVGRQAIERLEAIVADASIDCELERPGHIQAASKPSHFAAFAREQALLSRVFDHRVELVTRGDQETELGTTKYCGLLIDSRSAALNPARFVRGLAQRAAGRGVAIVTGRAVEKIDRHGTRWRISAGGVDLDAGDVLMATNGYISGLSAELDRRIVPIGSYVIATEPLPDSTSSRLIPRRRMAFDSKHLLHYFRLASDGRLLFGGRAQFSQPTPDAVRRAAEILRGDMVAVFPELAGVTIEYAWGGVVALTRDQMPHAGRFSGVSYAGGYCGHGIAMATLLGELIAKRIAGELFEHPLIDGPFPPIPLYRGKPWFLPLVGAYYTIKDWIE